MDRYKYIDIYRAKIDCRKRAFDGTLTVHRDNLRVVASDATRPWCGVYVPHS